MEWISKDNLKNLDFKSTEEQDIVMKLLDNQEIVKKPVEYGILLFDERDHYKSVYETFFVGNLFDNGDSWKFYKAYDGEFPNDEELKSMKGLVLPGSYRSVYDEIPAIEPYKQFIRKVYSSYPHIKMTGLCFGH